MDSAGKRCHVDLAAYLFSILGAPPLLAIPIAFLVGLRAGGYPRMATTVAELVVWVSVLPSLATFALYRAGRTSTLELRERTDRLVPSSVAAGCCAAAVMQMELSHAPPAVSRLTLGIGLQLALLLVLTFHWKVSYHAAIAASLVVVGHTLGDPALTIGVLVLAACVCWARIYRRRHTLAQVVAGVLTMAPVALLS